MDSIISKADCIEILKNYLCTSKDFKFISFEFKSISENVEGFMGEHNKLEISYEFLGCQKSHTFFVKSKPKNTAQLEIVNTLESYKREIFAYDTLIKEFDKVGYDTSFAAKPYYCNTNQTIIMEDVTLNGFSIPERHVLLTVDQLKCALKSLAMYHAAGYAYERTKSKQIKTKFNIGQEYNEFMKELFYIQYIDPSFLSMKWWNSGSKTLNVLIDLLPEDEAYKQEFKNLIDNAEVGKVFVTDTKINKTCGHGDLWSNNMLFKYKDNIAVECRLVDFQICRYFYPCFDILLAIYCNTNLEFRKQYLEELFSYYHSTLSEILKNYGFNIEDIYPLNDFYKSIDLVKVDALMQVLLSHIIILLPKEKLTEIVIEQEGEGFSQIMFENNIMAAEAFKRDEEYRKIISNTMYEIRDTLLKRTNNK